MRRIRARAKTSEPESTCDLATPDQPAPTSEEAERNC
jgi:hypothetical protein